VSRRTQARASAIALRHSPSLGNREVWLDGCLPAAKGTPQREFVDNWYPEAALIGGRGTHKTGHLLEKALISALVVNPGFPVVLTEQTGPLVRDVLVPMVRQFVNPDLYELRGPPTGPDVWLRPTGGTIRLRSRHARNRREDPPFRGPPCVMGGHDALARDRDPADEAHHPLAISAAMLRGNIGRYRTLVHTTTPVDNWFARHLAQLGVKSNDAPRVAAPGACAWYTATEDVDPELHARLVRLYSPEFADQELRARFVPRRGRVWTGYRDAEWPEGNRHWHEFDPGRPYLLGVDLGGGQSAWNLAQWVPAVDRAGHRVHDGSVLVTVAEYLPERVGVAAVLEDLISRYGLPQEVYVGADYSSPGSSGVTAQWLFAQRGIDWARPITGWLAGKDVQHLHASSLLLDGQRRRRFAVSQKLEQHMSRRARGILDVLSGDVWPESGPYYLEKDKRSGVGLEDARDAWLYLCAGAIEPQWGGSLEYAVE